MERYFGEPGLFPQGRQQTYERLTNGSCAYHMNHTPGADDPFAHKLVMNIGLNYQLNRRVIIMQAAQLDLAGTNAMRGAMWFMSFMFLT